MISRAPPQSLLRQVLYSDLHALKIIQCCHSTRDSRREARQWPAFKSQRRAWSAPSSRRLRNTPPTLRCLSRVGYCTCRAAAPAARRAQWASQTSGSGESWPATAGPTVQGSFGSLPSTAILILVPSVSMEPSGDKNEILDYDLKRVLIQNLRLPGLRMPQLELPLGGTTCALTLLARRSPISSEQQRQSCLTKPPRPDPSNTAQGPRTVMKRGGTLNSMWFHEGSWAEASLQRPRAAFSAASSFCSQQQCRLSVLDQASSEAVPSRQAAPNTLHPVSTLQ